VVEIGPKSFDSLDEKGKPLRVGNRGKKGTIHPWDCEEGDYNTRKEGVACVEALEGRGKKGGVCKVELFGPENDRE